MKITEHMILSDFMHYRIPESRIRPGHMLPRTFDYFSCPHCDHSIREEPKYGKAFRCEQCGMEMISHGNSLACTLEVTTIWCGMTLFV